jgi:signal transduction histidine kinase
VGEHGPPGAAFRAVSEAVLAVTSHLSVDRVLQTIVTTARELADADFAAIGVPDGADGFDHFLVAGISAAQWAAIGPLPRTHGLLGAMLADPHPLRLADVHDDPRFVGWPGAHPDMRSFLAVPVVAGDGILGAVYLARAAVRPFTADDEETIGVLAAHAAIALTHARLYERSRELSVVEERTRLARELHDAVAQTLFSLRLTAQAAAGLVRKDPERAEAELRRVGELSRQALAELRSVIVELRPADLAADGLAATLAKHIEVLRRAHGVEIALTVDGSHGADADVETAAYRIAQEALANALRHSGARRLSVRLDAGDEQLRLLVTDDGAGFDPAGARRQAPHVGSLGLTSMLERAAAVGGRLDVVSAPGGGTTVRLLVPAAVPDAD